MELLISDRTKSLNQTISAFKRQSEMSARVALPKIRSVFENLEGEQIGWLAKPDPGFQKAQVVTVVKAYPTYVVVKKEFYNRHSDLVTVQSSINYGALIAGHDEVFDSALI